MLELPGGPFVESSKLQTVSSASVVDSMKSLLQAHELIFGPPDLSRSRSREQQVRLTQVAAVYNALVAALGRPLRILDLDCGQSFASQSLAALGASVQSIDSLAANGASRRLSADTAGLEDVLSAPQANRYDLVIGMDVFDRLVHQKGLSSARAALRRLGDHLGDKVSACLLEVTPVEEPSHGAVTEPISPRDLLTGFAFLHEIARFDAASSRTARLLYFASNTYCYLSGKAYAFTEWTSVSNDSAPVAHEGTRRYYFNKDTIIKHFLLTQRRRFIVNNDEWCNEMQFLSNPPEKFAVPSLRLCGRNYAEAWLVRDLLPGERLDKRLGRGGCGRDPGKIVRDVLRQLAALERAKLYHNDVRTWNVLIDQDGGASLIDFGAITSRSEDCTTPKNIFLSFLIFMRAVFAGEREHGAPLRPIWFDPDRFPEPYRRSVWTMFQFPPETWSFSRLLAEIEQGEESRRNDDGEIVDVFAPTVEAAGFAGRASYRNIARRNVSLVAATRRQKSRLHTAGESLAATRASAAMPLSGPLPSANRTVQWLAKLARRLGRHTAESVILKPPASGVGVADIGRRHA